MSKGVKMKIDQVRQQKVTKKESTLLNIVLTADRSLTTNIFEKTIIEVGS